MRGHACCHAPQVTNGRTDIGTLAGLDGAKVCVNLVVGSACPTWADFCRGASASACLASFFDTTKKCCPLTTPVASSG